MTPSARQAELVRRLAHDATAGGSIAVVEWVEECGSTNTILGDRARAGERRSCILVTDSQTAGRGRLDRRWVTPPGTAFTGSLLVPATIGTDLLGLVPVVAGLAVLDTMASLGVASGVVRLKWPNDVIVAPEGRKLAGILCEATSGMVVIGIGLNVTRPQHVPDVLAERAAWIAELPGSAVVPPAMAEVAAVLLVALLERLGQLGSEPAAIVAAQRRACATIGQRVRVELPASSWTGRAVDVDDRGHLLVVRDSTTTPTTVRAGDVVHLREIDEASAP